MEHEASVIFYREKKSIENLIVVYAHRDGFSVWDSLKNSHLGGATASYQFSNNEVIHGTANICNGMARDLIFWSYDENMRHIFNHMFCLHDINLGKFWKMSVLDAKMMPSVMQDYGDVLLPRLPSRMKFDMCLIYLILWARFENKIASLMRGVVLTSQLVILIDDADRHLSIDPCGKDNILGMNLCIYLDNMSEAARASEAIVMSESKSSTQIIAASKDYSLNGKHPTSPIADSEWRIENTGSSVFVKVDTTTRYMVGG